LEIHAPYKILSASRFYADNEASTNHSVTSYNIYAQFTAVFTNCCCCHTCQSNVYFRKWETVN